MVNPASNVGVECIAIKRIDNPMGSSGYNISIGYGINCWFQGVESNKSAGAHMLALRCSNISVKGCYFHDAYEFTGSGTKGYGLVLAEHSGEFLIENNVFRKLRHAMMVKQGANGNVFAYNYSREPMRSEFPSNAGGDISLHGHFPYANLFEGNIVQNIMIDQAWGPSGPDNLFFRNRAALYGIIISSGTVQSNDQIFVGNEVTNNGFGLGNYILAGTGHLQHGNNIKGTITPAGTNTLNEQSYYLSSAPVFWNINDPWPSIGIPNTINMGNIPEKERYHNSNEETQCAEVISNLTGPDDQDSEVIVFPNPSDGTFAIKGITPELIQVFDLSGSLIRTFDHPTHGLFESVQTGVFYLRILSDDNYYVKKLLIY